MIILLLKIIRFNSLYIVPLPCRWSTYAQQPLWGSLLALANIHVIFSFRNGRRSRGLIAVVDLWSHESRQERMGWQHQLIGTRERRPDALAGTRLQYSLSPRQWIIDQTNRTVKNLPALRALSRPAAPICFQILSLKCRRDELRLFYSLLVGFGGSRRDSLSLYPSFFLLLSSPIEYVVRSLFPHFFPILYFSLSFLFSLRRTTSLIFSQSCNGRLCRKEIIDRRRTSWWMKWNT